MNEDEDDKVIHAPWCEAETDTGCECGAKQRPRSESWTRVKVYVVVGNWVEEPSAGDGLTTIHGVYVSRLRANDLLNKLRANALLNAENNKNVYYHVCESYCDVTLDINNEVQRNG